MHRLIVGVDTHKGQHVAVTLDGLGGRLDELFVPATNDGYADLLAWADGQGSVVSFGVEGTGSYGVGLARFLRRHGRTVIEVSRPPRKGERHAAGKSDTIDAEHAARQILAGTVTAVPKTADGDIETLRLIKVARDTAVKAHDGSGCIERHIRFTHREPADRRGAGGDQLVLAATHRARHRHTAPLRAGRRRWPGRRGWAHCVWSLSIAIC